MRLLLILSACTLWAQPDADAVRVIIMADDMGAAHGINAGTIRAFRQGVVRATNLIVPGPWLLDAIELLKENRELDAGVHLTLTSEWERVKWRPLTWAPSLVDENGYFFPMTRKTQFFPAKSSLHESPFKIAEVEKELRAQIETARRLLPRVSFVSAHMGAATSSPELRAMTERLAAEYKMPLVPGNSGAKSLGRVYRKTDTGEEKAEALAQRLEGLPPGLYYMIDHGALDNEEMRSVGHLGYRDVAEDRFANVECWTSKRVKEVVRRRRIQLVTWSEVLGGKR